MQTELIVSPGQFKYQLIVVSQSPLPGSGQQDPEEWRGWDGTGAAELVVLPFIVAGNAA